MGLWLQQKRTSSRPPCPRSPRQSRRRHPDPFQCFASMQPEPSKRNSLQTFGCSNHIYHAPSRTPTFSNRRSKKKCPLWEDRIKTTCLANLRCLVAVPRRESLLNSEACGHWDAGSVVQSLRLTKIPRCNVRGTESSPCTTTTKDLGITVRPKFCLFSPDQAPKTAGMETFQPFGIPSSQSWRWELQIQLNPWDTSTREQSAGLGQPQARPGRILAGAPEEGILYDWQASADNRLVVAQVFLGLGSELVRQLRLRMAEVRVKT